MIRSWNSILKTGYRNWKGGQGTTASTKKVHIRMDVKKSMSLNIVEADPKSCCGRDNSVEPMST